MNKSRGLTYIILVCTFIVIAFGIVYIGGPVNPLREIQSDGLVAEYNLLEGLRHPLAILLLQIVLIMAIARLFGNLANKLGQPLIVGEIIAGIILGPTLFGFLFPQAFEFIFPIVSYGTLKLLSEIGLIFFLFIVGMDLDLRVFRSQAKAALFVSNASLMFTTLVGMGAAIFFFNEYGGNGTSFISFSFFIGIAISITAFPILARIVQERGISKTPLGSMAITCAAAADFTYTLLPYTISRVRRPYYI
jgi:Kef-type K+ transport system membrane component KefB